jgi:hypothetical protein
MLRLTIELVAGGFEPMRRTIPSMLVSNMSDLIARTTVSRPWGPPTH